MGAVLKVAFGVCGLLMASVALSGSSDELNLDAGGLLLKGYDPVAYHTRGAALPGDPAITVEHGPAKVRFATEAHRERFVSTPDRYMPAYGGHCSYGVTQGERFDADPTAWRIVNGRLHVFLDQGTRSVWMLDERANQSTADRLWQASDADRVAAD